jgi:hypothetical protein
MARRKSEKQKTAAQLAFLNALAGGATVEDAARAAKTTRTTVYQWRAAEPAFAKEWAIAYRIGGDTLEAEAQRRAVEGTLKPVFHQGKVVGHVREYSDTLLIFLLKARNPQKFCDRVRAAAIEREIAAALAANNMQATSTAAEIVARLAALANAKASTAAPTLN